MNVKILQLSQAGQPLAWLNREKAATQYAKGRVLWELGNALKPMRGGRNRSGVNSKIGMSAIIACRGKPLLATQVAPPLSNALLFRRDGQRCMYCGNHFALTGLTRDHIIPRSQNGPDKWENVVAACKYCNNIKGGRTPEQAGMPLLAIPFAPNPFEMLFLANRHILADQMEYLSSRFSSKREWLQAA